jgi:hypothetical protein
MMYLTEDQKLQICSDIGFVISKKLFECYGLEISFRHMIYAMEQYLNLDKYQV